MAKKWPDSIERYRKYVGWECRDIPPDLVLAVIQNESNGVAGLAAGRQSKSRTYLPCADDTEKWVDRAYGLMQCVPGTVLSYNDYQRSRSDFDPNKLATWEDISGKDERAIRMQIAIGCYYLAVANKILNLNHPMSAPAKSLSNANADQIKLVLSSYAVGAGATDEKLKSLDEQNLKPTFANIEKRFPDWGKPANRPVYYAKKVFNRFSNHTDTKYIDFESIKTKAKAGALPIFLLAAFAAYQWRAK